MAPSTGGSRSGGRPYALVWSPIPLMSWLMPFIGHIGVCSSSGITYDFAGPYTVNEDALLFGQPTRYVTLGPHLTAAAKGPAPAAGGAAARAEAAGDHAASDVEAAAPYGKSVACAATEIQAGAGRVQPDGRSGVWGDQGQEKEASVARFWDHRLASAASFYRLMQYNLLSSNCHCFVAHFLNRIAYRGGGWDMVNLAVLMFAYGRYTSVGGLLYTWLPWLLLVALGGYFGQMWFLYTYIVVCVPLLTWFVLYTKCCWRDLSP